MKSPITRSSFADTICRYETYVAHPGPRAEKRERGAADPVARRAPAAPRIRVEQADRGALRRRAHVPRRLALPAAVPPREARMDSRPVDRESRTAPAALLPADAGGRAGPRLAARHVARVRRGHQPHRGTGIGMSSDWNRQIRRVL